MNWKALPKLRPAQLNDIDYGRWAFTKIHHLNLQGTGPGPEFLAQAREYLLRGLSRKAAAWRKRHAQP